MIYNKFDTEKCLKDIEKYIIESKDVKDIFIVMDRNKNIIEKHSMIYYFINRMK